MLEPLFSGGHNTIAGRLSGAFRHIGRDRIADEIIHTVQSAGYTVREQNPFEVGSPIILPMRAKSPYVNRLCVMWHTMRWG